MRALVTETGTPADYDVNRNQVGVETFLGKEKSPLPFTFVFKFQILCGGASARGGGICP